MTKNELMQKIKNEGAWIVNEKGYLLKAWKEGENIILRAYSENENGNWVTETYKRKEDEIAITEQNETLCMSLENEWIDSIDESSCPTDVQADEEYRAGITDAIKVHNTLAGPINIVTSDEEITIFAI